MRLFVGNLARRIDSERLRAELERFGVVEEIVLVTDRETGRRRSFGFVEMATAEQARLVARRLDGLKLAGRRLRVRPAKPRSQTGVSREQAEAAGCHVP